MMANRGVVLLKNIPPGFYQNQMYNFFSQFGKVLRVKLARSRKTTGSKGYAFIEFAYDEVAKIAADTMNNYLMFDHILKASFLPPDQIHYNLFKHWNTVKVSSVKLHKDKANRDKSGKEWSRLKNKKLNTILSILKKLKAFGLNFDCVIINESDNVKDESNEKDDDEKDKTVNGVDKEVGNEDMDKRESNESEENENSFLYIDPEDDGIYFKTPPNTKKVMKKLPSCKKSTSPIKSKSFTPHLLTSHKKKILSLPKFVFLRQAVPSFKI